jgi:hypothetical protein
VVVEQPTMLPTTPIPYIPTALEPASVGNDPVVDRWWRRWSVVQVVSFNSFVKPHVRQGQLFVELAKFLPFEFKKLKMQKEFNFVIHPTINRHCWFELIPRSFEFISPLLFHHGGLESTHASFSCFWVACPFLFVAPYLAPSP